MKKILCLFLSFLLFVSVFATSTEVDSSTNKGTHQLEKALLKNWCSNITKAYESDFAAPLQFEKTAAASVQFIATLTYLDKLTHLRIFSYEKSNDKAIAQDYKRAIAFPFHSFG